MVTASSVNVRMIQKQESTSSACDGQSILTSFQAGFNESLTTSGVNATSHPSHTHFLILIVFLNVDSWLWVQSFGKVRAQLRVHNRVQSLDQVLRRLRVSQLQQECITYGGGEQDAAAADSADSASAAAVVSECEVTTPNQQVGFLCVARRIKCASC